MATDSITLTIKARDMASAVMNRFRVSTVAVGVALGNLASKAITGAINGIRGWIDEALEAEAANVRLDAALRGLGQYTEELSKRYRALADAIQDETGASDESVKNNIALLASLGVMPDKMGEAARAMQALSSLNIEGSMAARALARALEGDMSGFDRLSPKVRMATTDLEKAKAINELVSAGYAQQRAKLNTVGGAWEALKGRLGDFREAAIGAVFDGLQLGKTFNSMQASVGAFLKSAQFEELTNRLKEGAAFAKDMFTALTSGGFGDTMKGVGNVIVAAFKEGAKEASNAILKAMTGDPKKITPMKEFRIDVATFFGTDPKIARKVVYDGADETGRVQAEAKSELAVEIEKLKSTVGKVVNAAETVQYDFENLDEELTKSVDNQKLINDKQLEEIRAKSALQAEELTGLKAFEVEFQENINAAAEREKNAREELAKNEERAAAISRMGVAGYIANQQAQREADKAFGESEEDALKKFARLAKKEGRAGLNMSEKDKQFLADARKGDQELLDQQNAAIQAANAAEDAAIEQAAWQKELKDIQRRIATATESMAADLKNAITEGGA